jgi:hypothetical protein
MTTDCVNIRIYMLADFTLLGIDWKAARTQPLDAVGRVTSAIVISAPHIRESQGDPEGCS